MKKHEFLQHLDAELTGFDQEERAQFLRYCDEMIEDRIEEGMSEEEAVGSEADIDALLESFRAHAKPDMHTAMDGTMKTWVADARNIRDIRVFVENNRLNLRESSGSSICVHYPEDSNYLISRSCEDGKFFFEMREKEKPSFTGFMNMFFGHRKSYTITVELPRGVAANAELSSCNAAIDVAHGGMSGELKLSTSNARISVGNICMDGSIHCKTSNARISLQDVEAQQICAHTTNGRIEAEHLMILDRAELVTTNGRIHLQDIQGGSAVLRTTNGSVNVDHGDLKALSMTSSNGAIRAKLAGTIRDYSVESGTSNGSNTLPASMPGGTRDLKAHTSNGSIKVEFDS